MISVLQQAFCLTEHKVRLVVVPEHHLPLVPKDQVGFDLVFRSQF